MLVSIAIFSVVLTVTLGSIVTIADSNRKARSLMSVMNNLNAAVDSMTRSIKTGTNLTETTRNGNPCVQLEQVNYKTPETFDRETVWYCRSAAGEITRETDSSPLAALTSPDVNIEFLDFEVFGDSVGDQPKAFIRMEGEVQVSPRVSSSFSIQTSVSQRQLNIGS